MKSAYELAMERLEKDSPSGPPLTNEQKTEIAEIQNKFQAKIAEKKILAENEKKAAMGNYQALQEIDARLKDEIHRLENECEQKKKEVRENH